MLFDFNGYFFVGLVDPFQHLLVVHWFQFGQDYALDQFRQVLIPVVFKITKTHNVFYEVTE